LTSKFQPPLYTHFSSYGYTFLHINNYMYLLHDGHNWTCFWHFHTVWEPIPYPYPSKWTFSLVFLTLDTHCGITFASATCSKCQQKLTYLITALACLTLGFLGLLGHNATENTGWHLKNERLLRHGRSRKAPCEARTIQNMLGMLISALLWK